MCACQKLCGQAAHLEIGPSSRWLFSARSSRESISRNAACQRTIWLIGWAGTSSELLKLVRLQEPKFTMRELDASLVQLEEENQVMRRDDVVHII